MRHVLLCTERDQKVGRAQSTTREPYRKMRLMEKGCHPVDMVETVARRTSASGGGKDGDGLRQRRGKFRGRDIHSEDAEGHVLPRAHLVSRLEPPALLCFTSFNAHCAMLPRQPPMLLSLCILGPTPSVSVSCSTSPSSQWRT